MNDALRLVCSLTGLFVFLFGWITQLRTLSRHRAPDSDGPWFSWRFQTAKRSWFATDYGYRQYRWASWNTLIGGLIMMIAWFL